LIVEAGIAKIIDDMTDLVSSAVVSSSSSDPAFSDTSITDTIATVSLSDITASNNSLTAQATIDSGTGNGDTIRKVAIKTSDTTLFSNDNHPDLEKTSSEEIRYLFKISLVRGN